ncbi:MAG: ABC transporter permease [Bacteroidota bacterium]
MYKSYFKIAYRKIVNNKAISAINIFGLTIAIGVSIAVFLFLHNHLTMDNFHENGDRIFIVEYEMDNGGTPEVWGSTPMPLAAALADDFPQIEHAVKVANKGGKVYQGENIFNEQVTFADPNYFDMFSFPLTSGKPEILRQPDGIIISTAVAEKYFPNENPIGQVLTVVFDNETKKGLTVLGVAAPFPENTGFKFGILAGFPLWTSLEKQPLNDWTTHTRGTFIQLRNPADISVIADNMDKYVRLHNAANESITIESFVFDNLKNPHANAHEVNYRPTRAGEPIVVFSFTLIGLLMMILSCFNYINISLGFVGKRLKEIGVRKAIGGKKQQLIVQFMAENFLLCAIALLFGLVVAQLVFIPPFNFLNGSEITLDFVKNPELWGFLAGLLVFTAIASGAYPAFYISSFQPVAIFKGSQQVIKKNKLTRLFLGLQFTIAFCAVIFSIIVVFMNDYWKQLDWGYPPNETMVVRLGDADQYDQLRNALSQNTYVRQIAGTTDHVGESMARSTIKLGETNKDMLTYQVGPNYLETMNLQLRQGRFFDARRATEDATAVVINQRFADLQNWSQPLDQTFRQQGQTYRVIGVVDNFKVAGFSKTLPTMFVRGDQAAYQFLTIRYESGVGQLVEDFAKKNWAALNPDIPFNFFHQALIFDSFYDRIDKVASIYTLLSGLALLIACLGLFGLASQNYARYLKEASIRKVLGATTRQILLTGNRYFIWMLLIASGLATTISWFGAQYVFAMMEPYIGVVELGIAPFVVGNLLVFLTAIIAIGGQSYQLVKITPADALRWE